MKLSPAEEELMNHLWRLKKAFLKDLLDAYPEPKPASTTLSTLLKRMQEKKYVAFEVFGSSRRYFPLESKESYFAKHVNNLIKNFFNGSPAQFASFFTQKTDLSKEELKQIKESIDEQLDKKQ